MSQALDILLSDACGRFEEATKAFEALTKALKHQRDIANGAPEAKELEEARREALSTPSRVSNWLEITCAGFDDPVSPFAVPEGWARVPVFLALAFGAPSEEGRNAALAHLRQEFLKSQGLD